MVEHDAPSAVDRFFQVYDFFYKILTNADLGSFASIVGAGISIAVILKVADIQKRVMLRLRAPDAISELSTRASAISSALQTFPASLPLIGEHVALAEVTLKNVSTKVSGDARKTVKVALKEIQRFRFLPIAAKTEDRVREVYLQLLVSIKAIENLMADNREVL